MEQRSRWCQNFNSNTTPCKKKKVFKDPKEVWFYNSMPGKTITQLAEKIKQFFVHEKTEN